MKTKNLEAIRNQILDELRAARLKRVAYSIDSFLLTYELAEVERELMISKIVDLCLTGK
jgi:hypothetical protein